MRGSAPEAPDPLGGCRRGQEPPPLNTASGGGSRPRAGPQGPPARRPVPLGYFPLWWHRRPCLWWWAAPDPVQARRGHRHGGRCHWGASPCGGTGVPACGSGWLQTPCRPVGATGTEAGATGVLPLVVAQASLPVEVDGSRPRAGPSGPPARRPVPLGYDPLRWHRRPCLWRWMAADPARNPQARAHAPANRVPRGRRTVSLRVSEHATDRGPHPRRRRQPPLG